MRLLLCLLASLFLVACSSEKQETKSDAAEEPAVAEDAARHTDQVAMSDMVVELATRNASCGCALKEIGHCGNYVEIDSRYVQIANGKELGLGGMEWCGREGVQVETAGEIKNGMFVAATLVVKEAETTPSDG